VGGAALALSGLNIKAHAEKKTGSISLYQLVCIESPVTRSAGSQKISTAYGVTTFRKESDSVMGTLGNGDYRRLLLKTDGYGPRRGMTASDTFNLDGKVEMHYYAPIARIHAGDANYEDIWTPALWTQATSELTAVTIRLDRTKSPPEIKLEGMSSTVAVQGSASTQSGVATPAGFATQVSGAIGNNYEVAGAAEMKNGTGATIGVGFGLGTASGTFYYTPPAGVTRNVNNSLSWVITIQVKAPGSEQWWPADPGLEPA
jgi:hypothetical protein